MNSLFVVGFLFIVLVDKGLSLKCYKCSSRFETADQACDLGLNSLPTEICNFDEQCYQGVYALPPIEQPFKQTFTKRGCGPYRNDCLGELEHQKRDFGIHLKQIICHGCNENLCNSAGYNQLSILSSLILLFIYFFMFMCK